MSTNNIGMVGTKRCSRCGEIKTLENFSYLSSRCTWHSHCKPCHAAQEQARRNKHHDVWLAQRRLYYTNNRHKVLAYGVKYHAKHRDERNARCRAWHHQNKEKVREQHKRYRAVHRDEMNAKARTRYAQRESVRCRQAAATKRWSVKNPGKKIAAWQRRQANKALVASTLTEAQWNQTMWLFGHQCAYCQCNLSETQIHRDHLIPLVRGGPYAMGNMVPACKTCNFSKNAKSYEQWMVGNGYDVAALKNKLAGLEWLASEPT